jgi:glycosyltransferase involved in cell wall biosynthesis
MRIVIVTDTWEPEVNGVVRTIRATREVLTEWGHEVVLVEPSRFRHLRCPFYPDIRLCFGISREFIQATVRPPCAVHISTEGPIGYKVASYCARRGIPFTTCYHTNFPEYLKKYACIPQAITFAFLRHFHRHSSRLLVATPSLEAKLKSKGFRAAFGCWSRGVDLGLFHPRPKHALDKPVALYVGRIAREKNIEAFLEAVVDCHKWVVGDGPHLAYLKKRYPQAKYLGCLIGEELAAVYAQADVFVFPSRTDTFGLVMVEALASGVPVAAYPVEGPLDVIGNGQGVGHLSNCLEEAILRSLETASPEACRRLAQQYTWQSCTGQFLNSQVVYGIEAAAFPAAVC